MTTALPYVLLSQLAADFRRQRMTESAAVCDAQHALLAECYGPIQPLRVQVRMPWLEEQLRILELHRQRAEAGDRYGRVDRVTALGSLIARSVIARFLNEGEQLVPRDVESFLSRIRKDVEAVFERINGPACAEAATVRCTTRFAMQYQQQQHLQEQERLRAAGEAIRAVSRLEALTGTKLT